MVVLVALIAIVGTNVVTSPTDSYLAYRKKTAEAVNAVPMEDQADLDKKLAHSRTRSWQCLRDDQDERGFREGQG